MLSNNIMSHPTTTKDIDFNSLKILTFKDVADFVLKSRKYPAGTPRAFKTVRKNIGAPVRYKGIDRLLYNNNRPDVYKVGKYDYFTDDGSMIDQKNQLIFFK